MKIIRRTQINAITPFDFISAIVLGELLGNAVYDSEVKIWSILYSLALWTALMAIVEKITTKFKGSRKLLEGDPAILVRDGEIDYNALKKEKLDINELLSLLRQKDLFSIREIEYALLEQSGNISVLKKPKYDTPTQGDLDISPKKAYLSVTLILDGEVVEENLEAIGFNKGWLLSQINSFDIQKIEDVFYADWKEDEGIHVMPRK
ncbi:DUF421 domain-containing protein [Alkaliphilus serpentinus]|uniref:DUF421 domain-containing protein n=2 Tax=Alkaliphilus serpentinus TaxID=1482731 RepID=A0A833HNB2_9FIRM|nr:DUF421 domain-containing protein [Alkaliphilus serpentinus]